MVLTEAQLKTIKAEFGFNHEQSLELLQRFREWKRDNPVQRQFELLSIWIRHEIEKARKEFPATVDQLLDILESHG